MRLVLIGLLAVGSVFGQGGGFPLSAFLALIRDYLSLAETQVQQIRQQNAEFEDWLAPKYARMASVLPFEIAAETAKEPIDEAVLGARYAEMERLRREIAARRATVIAANLRVLSEAQRTKMKALEEALQLVDTGAQAEGFLLMPNRCRDTAGTSTDSVVQDPLGGIRYGNVCTPGLQRAGAFARAR